MKHSILHIAPIAAVAAIALPLLTACQEEFVPLEPTNQHVLPDVDSIGNYEFRNEKHNIHIARAGLGAASWDFVFSPLNEGDNVTTYFTFSINPEFATGEKFFFTEHYHSIDYLFSYEDPAYSYRINHDIIDGWAIVKKDDNGEITVKLDAVLEDNSSFKIDITAPMKSIEIK